MKRKSVAWFLSAWMLLAARIVSAEATSPAVLVKNVTEEVLSILRTDKSIQAGNRQSVIALIENKVAPHFDFTRMTRLAVGRAHQDYPARSSFCRTAAAACLQPRRDARHSLERPK